MTKHKKHKKNKITHKISLKIHKISLKMHPKTNI